MCKYYQRSNLKCLLVDLDFRGSVGTPKYTIGTAIYDQHGHKQIHCLYYHSSISIPQKIYSNIFNDISNFNTQGGVVVINCFSCKYASVYGEFLKVTSVFRPNVIYNVQNEHLIGTQRTNIPSNVAIVKAPAWHQLDSRKYGSFDKVEIKIEQIVGVTMEKPLPPASCLPIGYKLILTQRYSVEKDVKNNIRIGAVYGVTLVEPTSKDNMFDQVTALVKYVCENQFELISGCVLDSDNGYYLVESNKHSILCA